MVACQSIYIGEAWFLVARLEAGTTCAICADSAMEVVGGRVGAIAQSGVGVQTREGTLASLIQ